jgi:hypothetical protein
MDDLVLVNKIQKRLQATLQHIGDVMISGGVTIMKNTGIYLVRHRPTN